MERATTVKTLFSNHLKFCSLADFGAIVQKPQLTFGQLQEKEPGSNCRLFWTECNTIWT